MSSIVETLRERVSQTQVQLEQAKKVTAEAQATQTALEEQLEAYSSALRFEERRNGSSGTPTSFLQPESEAQESANTAINKSLELRRILQDRRDGITPLDLHSELQKRGIEIGTNYVYGLLYKLKNGGEIRKKGRKFYWVESQEAKPAS